jgi:hypothetical protein
MSEFLCVILIAVLYVLKASWIPNLDPEVFYFLAGWIGLRQGTKAIVGAMESKNGKNVPPVTP